MALISRGEQDKILKAILGEAQEIGMLPKPFIALIEKIYLDQQDLKELLQRQTRYQESLYEQLNARIDNLLSGDGTKNAQPIMDTLAQVKNDLQGGKL
jgi:hypothetical protein